MHELRFTYQEEDLDELFSLEGETISKISPYCESTDKVITTSYYLSNSFPLIFKLEINITE